MRLAPLKILRYNIFIHESPVSQGRLGLQKDSRGSVTTSGGPEDFETVCEGG